MEKMEKMKQKSRSYSTLSISIYIASEQASKLGKASIELGGGKYYIAAGTGVDGWMGGSGSI